MPLATLFPEWVASRLSLKRKTQEADLSAWTNHVGPKFGHLPIASITEAQVSAYQFLSLEELEALALACAGP